jgi:DNA-directed RNA polymerase subunit H (RpoH/RPB5)
MERDVLLLSLLSLLPWRLPTMQSQDPVVFPRRAKL